MDQLALCIFNYIVYKCIIHGTLKNGFGWLTKWRVDGHSGGWGAEVEADDEEA